MGGRKSESQTKKKPLQARSSTPDSGAVKKSPRKSNAGNTPPRVTNKKPVPAAARRSVPSSNGPKAVAAATNSSVTPRTARTVTPKVKPPPLQPVKSEEKTVITESAPQSEFDCLETQAQRETQKKEAEKRKREKEKKAREKETNKASPGKERKEKERKEKERADRERKEKERMVAERRQAEEREKQERREMDMKQAEEKKKAEARLKEEKAKTEEFKAMDSELSPKKRAEEDKEGQGSITATFDQFLLKLGKKGWSSIAEEFRIGHKTNPEVNRATRYVINFNVPPDGDFYDANHVEVAGVENKFIIATAPTEDAASRETFWRMVYDSGVSSIFYLENYDAERKDQFLPWNPHDSRDYGKMTVMNKKVTADGSMQAILEVLPDGCSNSLITRFVQVHKWPEQLPLDGTESPEAMSAIKAVRLLKNEHGTSLVVCSNGLGKSAMFIMLHSIIARLNAKQDTSVPTILANIRRDRWGAIQTEDQYLTLHLLLLYYIKTKFEKLKEPTMAQLQALIDYLEKMRTKAASNAAPNQHVAVNASSTNNNSHYLG